LENLVARIVLTSQRAAEDGYQVCMVIPKEAEDIAYMAALPENLGLVITTSGLAIQAHNYFNAFVNADNVLAVKNDAAVRKLGLSEGQKIKYTSSGTDFSLEVYDMGKEIMEGVKLLMNS